MFAPKAATPATGGLSLNTNSTSSLLLVLPFIFVSDYTYQTYLYRLTPCFDSNRFLSQSLVVPSSQTGVTLVPDRKKKRLTATSHQQWRQHGHINSYSWRN